jgi:hypothetical protein
MGLATGERLALRLGRLGRELPTTVVLDEFQYLAQSTPSIASPRMALASLSCWARSVVVMMVSGSGWREEDVEAKSCACGRPATV